MPNISFESPYILFKEISMGISWNIMEYLQTKMEMLWTGLGHSFFTNGGKEIVTNKVPAWKLLGARAGRGGFPRHP